MAAAGEGFFRGWRHRVARLLRHGEAVPGPEDRLHTPADEHWEDADYTAAEAEAPAVPDPWDPLAGDPAPTPIDAAAPAPASSATVPGAGPEPGSVPPKAAAAPPEATEIEPDETATVEPAVPPPPGPRPSDSARQGDLFGPAPGPRQIELPLPPADREDWSDLEAAEEAINENEIDGAGDEEGWDSDIGAADAATPGAGDDPDGVDMALPGRGGDGEAVPGFDATAGLIEEDHSPAPVEAEAVPGTDADLDLDIRDFDEDAQQQPWTPKPEDVTTEKRKAREKAAAITALLEMPRRQQQDEVLAWLTEFFMQVYHPATYCALTIAATEGLTPELLRDMIELRRIWMERPEWWVGRWVGRRTGRWGQPFEIRTAPNGASMLTWLLAREICMVRSDYEPDNMIDEDWLEEWRELEPGEPGFIQFTSFIAVKLRTIEAEALDGGLHWEEEAKNQTGLDDDWYRYGHTRHDMTQYGLRVLTPYDERPGQLGHGQREHEPARLPGHSSIRTREIREEVTDDGAAE